MNTSDKVQWNRMRRESQDMEIRVKGPCKVRKRRCSSSSSSSLLRNYRLKRAILGGKRGGSSTPIPAWNMSSKPPLSARKLAATLWEIKDVASPLEKEIIEEYGSGKELRKNDRILRSSRFLDPSHIPVSEVGFPFFFFPVYKLFTIYPLLQ